MNRYERTCLRVQRFGLALLIVEIRLIRHMADRALVLLGDTKKEG